MSRCLRLRLLPVLVALITLLPIAPRAHAAPAQLRALWVDAFNSGIKSAAQASQLVADAKRGGYNALIVQVRRRGDAYYTSDVEPRTQDAALAPAPYDPLGTILAAAHKQGIQVHAWIATLAIWRDNLGQPADPSHVYWQHGPGAQGSDNWVSLGVNGETTSGGDTWLDPGHPSVVAYTSAVVRDLLAHYPALDGLQLDLMRYAGPSFGYNPVNVARFNERYGRWGTPDPTDPAWAQWRRDQVTGLMRKVALDVAEVAPNARLSLAAIAIGKAPTQLSGGWEASDPYSNRFQDWRGWLQEGILDTACVMNYDREADAAQREWYRGWASWEAGQAGPRAVVVGHGAWLNSPSATIDQITYAIDAGASGVASYAYSDLSGDASTRGQVLDALRAGPFAQSATVPAMPWKRSEGALAGDVWALPLSATDGVAITLSGPTERVLVSDGSGWFGTVGLAAGDYTVSVALPNGGIAQGHASVRAGGMATVSWGRAVRLEARGWLPLVAR